MRQRWIVATVLLISLVGTSAATARPSLPSKLDPGVLTSLSPRAIAMFDHDVDDDTIERLADAGITHAAVFDSIDTAAILGPRDVYIAIARWPDVISVEDDSIISFQNYVARGDTGVDDVRAGAEPLKIGYTGKGVTVAVVDSGVDTTHPDLSNVIVNVNVEPSPILDDITEGEYSRSYAEQPVGTDEYGHGTHVAGIVGGTGEMGRNVDQSGVAPEATMINVKLGLSPDFEVSALAAYDWILDHKDDPRFPGGIRVATNSWQLGDDPDPPGPLVLLLRKVVEQDVAVIFAAGNGGPEANTVPEYPNQMEEVVTVGAICKSDEPTTNTCAPGEVASFSSRGPQVDIAAPGVRVWSTKNQDSVLGLAGALGGIFPPRPGDPDQVAVWSNNAWYMAASGTSMATPHVAGIVALMLEANPKLSPKKIEKILIKTATDAGTKGFDTAYGFGVVNAFKAVAAAEKSR